MATEEVRELYRLLEEIVDKFNSQEVRDASYMLDAYDEKSKRTYPAMAPMNKEPYKRCAETIRRVTESMLANNEIEDEWWSEPSTTFERIPKP